MAGGGGDPFFSGGAAQAVQLAKSQRKPLVVFLKGEDDASAAMEAHLLAAFDAGVMEGVVCCRFTDDLEDRSRASPDALMFRSLPAYATDCLPTVGLIGADGAPLVWVKGGAAPAEEVHRLLQGGKEQFQQQVQAELAAMAFAAMAQAATPQQPAPPTAPAAPAPPAAPSPGMTAQARARTEERAAEAVLQLRRDQAAERAATEAEVERRKEDAERQRAREEKLARQRADDEKRRKAEAEAARAAAATGAARAAAEAAMATGVTHIQVRLTSGENLRTELAISATLSEVVAYVDANRTDGAGPYALMTTYPKRTFTKEDLGKTLTELCAKELCPRAALMLQASKGGAGGAGGAAQGIAAAGEGGSARTWGGYLGSVVGGVGRAVGGVLSYVNPLGYMGGPQYQASPQREQQIRAHGQQHAMARGGGAGAGGGAQQGAKRAKSGGGSRGFGNVATLQRDEDDDDSGRNKFWNGNSTQFGGGDGEPKP